MAPEPNPCKDGSVNPRCPLFPPVSQADESHGDRKRRYLDANPDEDGWVNPRRPLTGPTCRSDEPVGDAKRLCVEAIISRRPLVSATSLPDELAGDVDRRYLDLKPQNSVVIPRRPLVPATSLPDEPAGDGKRRTTNASSLFALNSGCPDATTVAMTSRSNEIGPDLDLESLSPLSSGSFPFEKVGETWEACEAEAERWMAGLSCFRFSDDERL